MKLKQIRNNIQERVEKSAWTLSGMKAYEKVRVELVIWAFIFFVAVLALLTDIIISKLIFNQFTFRIYSYLSLMGLSLLAFLGKSFQFRHFYMLNKIKEAQNEIK